ncbi:MAG TPA: hypothetical protein VGF84_08655, partial [Micromonosporaceae bacterium]
MPSSPRRFAILAALILAGTVAACSTATPVRFSAPLQPDTSASPKIATPAGTGSPSASPSAKPSPSVSAKPKPKPVTLPKWGNRSGHASIPAAARAVSTAHPNHVIGHGTASSCTSAAVVAAV